MRIPRFVPSFVPAVLAGIVILGSGCAKTDHNTPGEDTTLHRDSTRDVGQNQESNPVGQRDNYNAKSSAVDTGAERGSTNDSIARGGPPVQRGATTGAPNPAKP